jgi:hypothetical protein
VKKVKKAPVAIRFLDHVSDCGNPEEMKLLECEAGGYLVHEDKLHYRLLSWITNDEATNHNNEAYLILKSTVLSVRRFS